MPEKRGIDGELGSNPIEARIIQALIQPGIEAMPPYEVWQAIDRQQVRSILEAVIEPIERRLEEKAAQEAQTPEARRKAAMWSEWADIGGYTSEGHDPAAGPILVVHQPRSDHPESRTEETSVSETGSDQGGSNWRDVHRKFSRLNYDYEDKQLGILTEKLKVYELVREYPLAGGGYWVASYKVRRHNFVNNRKPYSMELEFRRYESGDYFSTKALEFRIQYEYWTPREEIGDPPRLLEKILIRKKQFDPAIYLEIFNRSQEESNPAPIPLVWDGVFS